LPDVGNLCPANANAISLVEAGELDQLEEAMRKAHALVRSGAVDRRRIRDLTSRASWRSFRAGVAASVRRCAAPREPLRIEAAENRVQA